jgi:hypothetical protein
MYQSTTDRALAGHSAYHAPQGWRFIDVYEMPSNNLRDAFGGP